MEDPILHLAVHLTLVGALREGEIVGLTPEDIDFDEMCIRDRDTRMWSAASAAVPKNT